MCSCVCLYSVYKGVHTDTHKHKRMYKEKGISVNGVNLWAEELRVTLIFSFTHFFYYPDLFSIMKINTFKIVFFSFSQKEVNLGTYPGP